MIYGIYEKGDSKVFMFMGETTYVPAYFFDWEKEKAEEICKYMNENSPRQYELREV
jgi:hypothetical protein